MMLNPFSKQSSEEVMCTVRVNNTFDSLAAHVEIDGDVKINPGDEVLVHGREIRVPYGETRTERRQATIRRAGFTPLGWFAPTPEDKVPDGARFVILIGNAGPDMFRRFARERDKASGRERFRREPFYHDAHLPFANQHEAR